MDGSWTSKIIFEKYLVEKLLGTGSFGAVYQVKDLNSNLTYALKVEMNTLGDQQSDFGKKTSFLMNEKGIMEILASETCFPHVIDFYQTSAYTAVVMTLFGSSLQNCFNLCNQRFTLSTVKQIALRLIDIFEVFHDYNFIHRDIKPLNFVIGCEEDSVTDIFLIDFGLSMSYRSKQRGF